MKLSSFIKQTAAAALLGASALVGVHGSAAAQAYPSQDIRFV